MDRLEALEPKVLAGHHSSAITGNAVQALRDLRRELFKEARTGFRVAGGTASSRNQFERSFVF